MSPEYIELIRKYDMYKNCNDELVDKLQSCIQQDHEVIGTGKIEHPPAENPYEKLSTSFYLLFSFLPREKHNTVQSLISITQNLAKVQRANQLSGRKAIRHLRRFYSVEYKEVMDEREKLDKVRDHMDRMKHEVKTSKTTEKIEKYAILYEQSVEEFDAQAKRTIVLLNQLPNITAAHLKDIKEFWSVLHDYHQESEKCIDLEKMKKQ